MKRDYIKPNVELIDFKLTEAIMNTIEDSGNIDNTSMNVGDEGVGDW